MWDGELPLGLSWLPKFVEAEESVNLSEGLEMTINVGKVWRWYDGVPHTLVAREVNLLVHGDPVLGESICAV